MIELKNKVILDNNLEQIMKEAKIGSIELAEKANVHRNTITRAKKGINVHLNEAHSIAKALNKTVYQIWNLE